MSFGRRYLSLGLRQGGQGCFEMEAMCPRSPVGLMLSPLILGHDYSEEERAGSDSFGPGEWDDRKVRHTFIQKVRNGLRPRGGLGAGT